MKTLERAARAACEDIYPPNETSRVNWEHEGAPFRAFYVSQARAAIRSIREPDEEVIEAMAAALVRPTLLMGGSSPLAKRQALAIWQAGIDAMLEEGK